MGYTYTAGRNGAAVHAILEREIRARSSLDDHTLEVLAELGHPYRIRGGIARMDSLREYEKYVLATPALYDALSVARLEALFQDDLAQTDEVDLEIGRAHV